MSLLHNPKIPEGINYSQGNPIKEFFILLTGLVISIVLLVVALSYSAQLLAPYIPFSWEVSLASTFVNQETGQNEEAEKSTWNHAQEALQELGGKLAEQAELEAQYQLKFHLINSDVPNAFATLGGHIFVSSALLKTISSENALAMVIAHEIAHVKFRHPIQALSRVAVIELVFSALSGSSGGTAIHNVLGQAGLLTLLSFNREMETESDQEALAILRRSYGHIVAADEFFRQMSGNKAQPGWVNVFQTHPNVEERIDIIRRAIKQSTAKLTAVDVRLTALSNDQAASSNE